MPIEMIIDQDRMWEIRNRDLSGYCRLACSIFWRSKKNRIIEIVAGENVCYCIKDPSENINNVFLKYIMRIFHLIEITFRISLICKKNRIDAIISYSNGLRELELASLFTARILSIPIFGYIGRNPRGMEVDKSHSIEEAQLVQNNFAIKLERYILNKVDKTILRPGTEDLYGKLYNIDSSKVISIPHKTIFHQFLKSFEISIGLKNWMKGKKVIMNYGRIDVGKFVDDLIKSFKLINSEYKDVCLLLIGDGPEKSNCISLVRELGLVDYVRFENSMSQKKIAAIINNCDILIPGFGGGKCMFEAALAGKPLVTYDMEMGHYFGLIEHMKTALVAKNRDIEDLAKCIKIYLSNPNLCRQVGIELQKRAKEHNNWAKTDKKIATAIEEVISN